MSVSAGDPIQLELFDPDDDGPLDFGEWMESLPLDPWGDEGARLFTADERRIAKERIDKARRARLEREDAERRKRDAEMEWG
jgi:hypothetical protein